jgi:NADH-quinone oxidoreductase subunit L
MGDAHLDLGYLLNPLTAIMLVVVTSVSLLVQIYSQGYMDGDPGYSRYFAYMSIFTMSMLGLVLANNFLLLFISWELVGACSYLLIGFWFKKPEAAAAAKKAFIVTRFGDLGFLVGILLVYANTQSLMFDQAEKVIASGMIGTGTITLIALCLFSGAMGKSAQFPLHVWLPDAMEGPTPVSALIHAATMVAAGVYMVARLMFIFQGSGEAMLVVACIGGFTAIFAASMGLVMNDVKRVLAYSTVSQLGYMMLGLGVGGFVAGVFHLMNHAFFKALLFLGSGAMIHATGTQDIREMGGLRKAMPITFATFSIAALSLAGIFPLSGFWSKDEILADVLSRGEPIYLLLFAVALLGAFMTAFYMFRVIFIAFFGDYRGPVSADSGHESHTPATFTQQPVMAAATSGDNGTLAFADGGVTLTSTTSSGGHATAQDAHGIHKIPWVMSIPLIVLTIPAIFSGLVNVNGQFAAFLGEHYGGMNLTVASISSIVALAGILLAWAMYYAKIISPVAVAKAFGPLYTLVLNKYYLDYIYEDLIVRGFVIGVSNLAAAFNKYVVDGIVNLIGLLIGWAGSAVRRLETGQMQNYGLAFFGGIFVIMVFLIFGL